MLFLRNIEIDGPYNPPKQVLPENHRRIMAHSPGAIRWKFRQIIDALVYQAIVD